MLISWTQYLSASSEIPSQVLSQFLWYNNYTKIEDAVVHFENFSSENINFLSQGIWKWQDRSMSQSQRWTWILEWRFI